VIIGQELALTGYLDQFTVTRDVQTVDVTTFGRNDREFIPGIGSGSMSVGGVFDRTGIDAEYWGNIASAAGELVTVGIGGTAIGNQVHVGRVRQGSYTVSASVEDAVRISGTFDFDAGVRMGRSLHLLEAETTTEDHASIDDSASSAFGGVGYIHVTAFTGTTGVVKIQHSANDSTWADLITFTTIAGVTQERVAVTGTVNRYLRAAITADSFTTMTYQASFARNRY
jgi:hypothetical protein